MKLRQVGILLGHLCINFVVIVTKFIVTGFIVLVFDVRIGFVQVRIDVGRRQLLLLYWGLGLRRHLSACPSTARPDKGNSSFVYFSTLRAISRSSRSSRK